MTRRSREFIQTATQNLDELLASVPANERHDILDELASRVEDRLDALAECDGEEEAPA